MIVNEKNKTVKELWDGQNLKCTFTRIVDDALMLQWEEVFQLASTIRFTESDDEIIWSFSSNGVYSQSLYRIINFMGVTPVHVPAVWALKIPPPPPPVHFFS